jgi:hypothetical protein
MHLKPDSNVEEALKIGPGSVGKKYQNNYVMRRDTVEHKLLQLLCTYRLISCMSSGNIMILTLPPLSLSALAY